MIYRISNEVACANLEVLFALHDFNRVMPIAGWDFWGNPALFEICQQHAHKNIAMTVDELACWIREEIGSWEQARLMAFQYHHFCQVRQEDEEQERRRKWWGVEGNALQFEMDFDQATAVFCTIKAVPLPVYLRLSFLFPDEYIHVRYASENLGLDAGTMTFSGGRLDQHTQYADEGKKAYEEGFYYWGRGDTYIEEDGRFVWQGQQTAMVS